MYGKLNSLGQVQGQTLSVDSGSYGWIHIEHRQEGTVGLRKVSHMGNVSCLFYIFTWWAGPSYENGNMVLAGTLLLWSCEWKQPAGVNRIWTQSSFFCCCYRRAAWTVWCGNIWISALWGPVSGENQRQSWTNAFTMLCLVSDENICSTLDDRIEKNWIELVLSEACHLFPIVCQIILTLLASS